MVPWGLPVDLPNILAIIDCLKTWLGLIKRSFQGLSIVVKTMGVDEELMEIWPNEVCDSLKVHIVPSGNHNNIPIVPRDRRRKPMLLLNVSSYMSNTILVVLWGNYYSPQVESKASESDRYNFRNSVVANLSPQDCPLWCLFWWSQVGNARLSNKRGGWAMKKAGCLNWPSINQRENQRCQVSKQKFNTNRPEYVKYLNGPPWPSDLKMWCSIVVWCWRQCSFLYLYRHKSYLLSPWHVWQTWQCVCHNTDVFMEDTNA